MDWIDPIFDRTQADVDFAKLSENRNLPEAIRGCLDYRGWNRITGNMYYLADLLTSLKYNVTMTCKNNWTIRDIPTQSQIQHIKSDLELLRESFFVFKSSKITPELPYNKYDKINDIEHLLFDIEDSIRRMERAFRPLHTFDIGADLL